MRVERGGEEGGQVMVGGGECEPEGRERGIGETVARSGNRRDGSMQQRARVEADRRRSRSRRAATPRRAGTAPLAAPRCTRRQHRCRTPRCRRAASASRARSMMGACAGRKVGPPSARGRAVMRWFRLDGRMTSAVYLAAPHSDPAVVIADSNAALSKKAG
jgi:hypothetical protein